MHTFYARPGDRYYVRSSTVPGRFTLAIVVDEHGDGDTEDEAPLDDEP